MRRFYWLAVTRSTASTFLLPEVPHDPSCGGGIVNAPKVLFCLATALSLLTILTPLYSQPQDDLDYRALGAPIWIDDWTYEFLASDAVWGDWPLDFVNKRAVILSEDKKKPDGAQVDPAVLVIADNTVMGVNYRWSSPKTEYGLLHEGMYAHTTDPASLVLFSTPDGVELRWQLDERLITLIQSNDCPDPDDVLRHNMIYRRAQGEQTYSAVADLDPLDEGVWVDTSVASGIEYSYFVTSVLDDGTEVGYSDTLSIVHSGQPSGPVFWIGQLDEYRLDAAADTQVCTNVEAKIELLLGLGCYQPGHGEAYPVIVQYTTPARADTLYSVSLVGEQVDGDYWFYTFPDTVSIITQVKSLWPYGCKFQYVVGEDTLEALGGELFTTCSNNRLRSRHWYCYEPNIASEDYRNAYDDYTHDLKVTFGTGVLDGLFCDSAMTEYPYYNYGKKVLPREFDVADYEQIMFSFFDYLRDESQESRDLKIIANNSTSGFERLDGAIEEHAFTQIDHGVSDTYTGDVWRGQYKLLQRMQQSSMSYVLAWPDLVPDEIGPRLYTIASFLMLMEDPTRDLYTLKRHLFPGVNRDRVCIMPEQMLGWGALLERTEVPVGDVSFDINAHMSGQESDKSSDVPQDLYHAVYEKGLVLLNINHPTVVPDPKTYDLGTSTRYRVILDGQSVFDGGRISTEPVSGVVEVPPMTGMLLMNDPISSPQVAEESAQPLIRGEPTRLLVAASHWNGERLWMEVELDALGLTDQRLVLTDDGQGEDVTADDGLYTGWEKVTAPASLATGFYPLRYYARGTDGLAVYDTLWVRVEAGAKMVNVSNETNLDYEGTGTSSVTFDYDGDGLNDLFVGLDVGAYMYKCSNIGPQNAPVFLHDNEVFEVGSLSGGFHGTAIADYDNDGDLDLFCTSTSNARFYKNMGDGATPRFVDVAEAEGVAPYTADSWSVLWCDYDEDGRLDLLIGTIDTFQDDFTPTSGCATGPLHLLRNTGNGFADVTAGAGLGDIMSATMSMDWGDINGDGHPDLFIGNYLDYSNTGSGSFHYGSSFLRLNDGAGHLVEPDDSGSNLPRFPEAGRIQGITGVEWVDLDQDGDLDLVLSSESPYGLGNRLYFNDGSGFFNQRDPVELQLPGGASSLTVFDQDLNGRPDLLYTSRAGNTPWLFLNYASKDGIRFVESSAAVGLDAVGTATATAVHDWNGDGDQDLFLGMPVSSQKFFYKTTARDGQEAVPQHSLELELHGSCLSPGHGTGARVTVSAGGVQQTRMVDGGGGRGTQGSHTLVFGLGDWNGDVEVTIRWPRGNTQSVSISADQLPGPVVIAEEVQDPAVIDDSIHVQQSMHDGLVDWTFTWRTQHESCPALDKVEISGPAFGDNRVFSAGPGDSVVLGSDGTYLHTLHVNNWPCAVGNYTYRVRSEIGPYVSESGDHVTKTKVCTSRGYPNAQ